MERSIKWEEFNRDVKNKKLVLFGASSCAKKFLSGRETYDIAFIVDNDREKWGTLYEGRYPVKSPEALKELDPKEAVVFITSSYYKEIGEQVKETYGGKVYSYLHLEGIAYDLMQPADEDEKYIGQLLQLLEDETSRQIIRQIIRKRKAGETDYTDLCQGEQYFVSGIFEPGKNEIFVDAGAYDGATMNEFINWTKGEFDKIYSFEMDKKNYEAICSRYQDKRIEIYPYGLWDKDGSMAYIPGDSSSRISDGGGEAAQVRALDHIVTGPVSFIKMDIEGAEQQALLGAERIIREYKPKLAVCLYHKKNDLWEIPFWVKALVPEYKLYIRHHECDYCETVLYAHI